MQNSIPLETILAYYHIQPFLKQEDWIELGKRLEVDEKEAEERIRGKILEDNFFLIARCYQNVESIILFNEVLSKITGTASADGLIVFKSGEKFLVEVKSTKKPEWKISRNQLEKQTLLADRIQARLVYAVFVEGYWGVYSPDFLVSNDYKIKHMQDLKSSLFDSMFDSKLVKIPRGLQIIKQFSTSSDAISPPGIHSKEYGHVIRYLVRYGNLLHQLDDTLAARAFTAIEVALSGNTRILKVSDTQTDIVSQCLADCFINDCRLSIEHILITINHRNEQRFNASSFLTHVVSAPQAGNIDFSIGVQNGLALIGHLITCGFPFEIIKASESNYLDTSPLT